MILKASTISAKNFLINASKKKTIFKERKEVLLKIAEEITADFLKRSTININFIGKTMLEQVKYAKYGHS